MFYEMIGFNFVYNSAFRKFDLWWSVGRKNRGQSKKTKAHIPLEMGFALATQHK